MTSKDYDEKLSIDDVKLVYIMNKYNTGLGLLKFGDCLRMIMQRIMREMAITTFPQTVLFCFESGKSIAASLKTNAITNFIQKCKKL